VSLVELERVTLDGTSPLPGLYSLLSIVDNAWYPCLSHLAFYLLAVPRVRR